MRVGDWRLVYEIDDNARLVRVVAVKHRSEAYE
jgi:mRNA-degrading endonuclease RelE of RelBE toxin-antitoxin system